MNEGQHEPSDAELLFEALMEHLPEAVWIRDHEGRMITANAESLRLLNMDIDKLRGTRASDLRPGHDAEVWSEQDRHVVRTGKPLEYEHDVDLPSGTRTLLTVKVPWQDRQGNRGVVGIARDITKRKALERAERHAREQLIVMQAQALRDLVEVQERERERVGRSLHDGIGSGLSSLLFQLDACLQGAPEDLRVRLGQVRVRGERLMRSLRVVSRGLHAAELEDLGLEAALQQLCMEWTRLYGVSVDLDLSAWTFTLGPQCSKAIYRVVQEALENVARLSVAKHVSVVGTQLGSQLRLSIEDDGPSGVGATLREQGLHSVRERIRLLQGQTLIEEASFGGTTLHFQIPVERACE